MTDDTRTVVPFPPAPGVSGGYTDTAALNDIHAILCRPGGWEPGTLDDVAGVLTRCGRPVIDIRDIAATVTDTTTGLPQGHIDAGTTNIWVRQGPTGGLIVAITASTADAAALTITLNDQRLHCPSAGAAPGKDR